MAGIYLHIPFCKQKCYYCDFYMSVSQKYKSEYVDALLAELQLQKKYLGTQKIKTIYFGGGTPSVLQADEIERILQKIRQLFEIETHAEITLEANPDDLNLNYLSELITLGVNRLSIGIQSFRDFDLKNMNRSHTGQQAFDAVKNAQKAGFNNISIDLIYGLPQLDLIAWEKNIHSALQLDIQHISAYHLSYEPNTVFSHLLKKKKMNIADEDSSYEQFRMLIDALVANEFEHYEISNFAKKGFISQHNSSYWKQAHYLGVGTSAHSFNGVSRQWNIKHLYQYIQQVKLGNVPAETEHLTETEMYNDYIITSLRTSWGADLEYIKTRFGQKLHNSFLHTALSFSQSEHLIIDANCVKMSKKGIFVSDAIFEKFIL